LPGPLVCEKSLRVVVGDVTARSIVRGRLPKCRMFEHRLFNDFVTRLVVIDPINVVLAFMLFTGDDPPESGGGQHCGRS
jgi:hypothetical protein